MKLQSSIAVVFCICLSLIASGAVAAQAADAFQRYFKFHNSLPATTIYPVIQSPQDGTTNCGSGGLLRIIVNKDSENAGIPPGQSVTVALPKDVPCSKGGFYDASRIYVFSASFAAVENLLSKSQQTRKYPNWDYGKYSPCAGCWVGLAGVDGAPAGDYGYDVPGQLLEYTIISQNPADGSAFPNANDINGTPLIDFDVSYVDYANLPFTMALGDGGATQFMGSTLPVTTSNVRLTQFVTDAGWSRFAAYAPQNWATPAECPKPGGAPSNPSKTKFSCLVPRTDVAPSSAILIATAATGGTTNFYLPQWDGKYPRACNTRAADPLSTGNLQCGQLLPNTPLCCPDVNNVMQGCCDMINFQIEKTTRTYNLDVTPNAFRYGNATLDNIQQRIKQWQGAGNNPCGDPNSEAMQKAPVVDRAGFCAAYKKTVDYVWANFAGQCAGLSGDTADKCTVRAIIGYDLKSGYNPKLCKKCPSNNPNDCPASCTQEAMSNESVQALQRGLPWTPSGDPSSCRSCPSNDPSLCSSQCVLPLVPSPQSTLYHRDKFLHFWAPHTSVYNINPYAWFVHNMESGFAAPGAYSFSIDDFYGNFGGPGSTLIIEAGGFSTMPNQEPFDPFKQYHSNMGTGWDHATVCGRLYRLPRAAPANVGLSAPLSFWNDGKQSQTCEVRLFATADETKYITFLLKELQFGVSDTYTGKSHSNVHGLSGVYAVRDSKNDSPPDDPYCTKNSTATDLVAQGLCRANLSAGTLNLDYVGVSNKACAGKNYDATCGKPLVNLNVPSRTAQK